MLPPGMLTSERTSNSSESVDDESIPAHTPRRRKSAEDLDQEFDKLFSGTFASTENNQEAWQSEVTSASAAEDDDLVKRHYVSAILAGKHQKFDNAYEAGQDECQEAAASGKVEVLSADKKKSMLYTIANTARRISRRLSKIHQAAVEEFRKPGDEEGCVLLRREFLLRQELQKSLEKELERSL